MRLPAPPLPDASSPQAGLRGAGRLSHRQAVMRLARGLMGGLVGVVIDAVLPERPGGPPAQD